MRFLTGFFVALSLLGQEVAPSQEPKPVETQTEQPAAAAPAEAEQPAAVTEENVSGSVDLGYRWMTDIAGSANTYRSIVNLGEGPRLLGVDLTFQDPNHRFFDRIDVRGIGWGGDPYNTARIDARRTGLYYFLFDYRNIAYFNYLPSFANPLLEQGILMNQRSFDIQRRYANLEFDLFPGRRFIPFVGYTRDSGFGHGITTFVGNSNEYPVRNRLDDTSDRIRGGLRLEFNRFHVTLEQGFTRFSDDQRVFATDPTTGNRLIPLLGQNLFLSDVNQQYGIRGEGIYSKVLATARPANWAHLFGQFLYSQPDTEVNYNANAVGNFALLSQLLFFNNLQELATGEAKQPHTLAHGGMELRPLRWLRISESLSTDRLHVASTGFFTEQLLTIGTPLTTNLVQPRRLFWNYNQQEINALVDLTRYFTFRAGHRYVWGDAGVPPRALSPTGEQAEAALERHVFLAGVTARVGQRLSFSAEQETADGRRSYFRTSLYDYVRFRLRGRVQALNSLIVSARLTYLNNENPAPTINYDFLSRDNSVSVFWNPWNGRLFNLTGDYTRSTVRSDITYLAPQNLQRERSFYRDNAHVASAIFDFGPPGARMPRFGVGGALFVSSGSRPTDFYQPLLRVSVPFHRNAHFTADWRWHGFNQDFYDFETFRAHLFTVGLRILR